MGDPDRGTVHLLGHVHYFIGTNQMGVSKIIIRIDVGRKKLRVNPLELRCLDGTRTRNLDLLHVLLAKVVAFKDVKDVPLFEG